MKSFKYLLILIILILKIGETQAQSRRLYYKQKIPNNYLVREIYTVNESDTLKMSSGDIHNKTFEKTEKNGIMNTYTVFDTLKKDIQVFIKQEKFIKRRIPGSANIYFDKENDRSKLYINYWLPKQYLFLEKGTSVIIEDFGIKKSQILKENNYLPYTKIDLKELRNSELLKQEIEDKNELIKMISSKINYGTQVPDMEISLRNKQTVNLDTMSQDDLIKTKNNLISERDSLLKHSKNSLWMAYTKSFIHVDNDTYAKKYPSTAYINLNNREYVKLKFHSLEMGALVIPFKIRPDIEINNTEVIGGGTVDLNIGTYLGFTMGKLKYGYTKGSNNIPYGHGISVGTFLGAGLTKLDSTSTLKKPLLIEKSIFTISPGVAVTYHFYDFNIGLYYGWDLGIDKFANRWNYQGKGWLGFGIGYNLKQITAQFGSQ